MPVRGWPNIWQHLDITCTEWACMSVCMPVCKCVCCRWTCSAATSLCASYSKISLKMLQVRRDADECGTPRADETRDPRPETRDQSSCSPCAVNALCSISLVVWHYFWRPRRRRVAALLLWCMTRRYSVRSYSGDSTSKHNEIFCIRLSLWLFLFWLFLMRSYGISSWRVLVGNH